MILEYKYGAPPCRIFGHRHPLGPLRAAAACGAAVLAQRGRRRPRRRGEGGAGGASGPGAAHAAPEAPRWGWKNLRKPTKTREKRGKRTENPWKKNHGKRLEQILKTREKHENPWKNLRKSGEIRINLVKRMTSIGDLEGVLWRFSAGNMG